MSAPIDSSARAPYALTSDESGARPALSRHPTYALVLRWNALQPEAGRRPADVRTLTEDIDAAIARCVQMATDSLEGRLDALSDDWLDDTYVLERLQFCVQHGVPYVVRPRAPQAP